MHRLHLPYNTEEKNVQRAKIKDDWDLRWLAAYLMRSLPMQWHSRIWRENMPEWRPCNLCTVRMQHSALIKNSHVHASMPVFSQLPAPLCKKGWVFWQKALLQVHGHLTVTGVHKRFSLHALSVGHAEGNKSRAHDKTCVKSARGCLLQIQKGNKTHATHAHTFD